MNYHKKSVRDLDLQNKKVLLRCDFNVPHDKKTGVISDDTRIAASLPTIEYLLEQGASVILCSHFGRPGGVSNPAFSLASAAKHLGKLIGKPIPLSKDVCGPDTKRLAGGLTPGKLMMIENLRFRPEEEKNDDAFAKELADLADVFVFDAFGSSHRAHASTHGVMQHLPSVCGLLVERELRIMGDALHTPKRPLVAVLGGSKVSDKIGVLKSLLDIADAILIGGGMAYTFLAAEGYSVGKSLLDHDHIDFASEVLAAAKEKDITLLLPTDHIGASMFSPDAHPVTIESPDIPDTLMGLDIGHDTREQFQKVIESAGTVLWNGPMGVFEFPDFSEGTRAVAEALAAQRRAITIIGGGDSASAAEQMGVAGRITHISTGGGASLEFLEGRILPGIDALENAD